MSSTAKVALAFSGGLDTSFCVPYLINERHLEVHTVTVNTGGFSADEVKSIEQRAKMLAYYMGEAKFELAPPEIEGRSQVVSKDMADTVEWMISHDRNGAQQVREVREIFA